MLVFAFCLLGLIIALIRFGVKHSVNSTETAKIKKADDDRKKLISFLKASPEQINQANSHDDYDDVREDVIYITGSEKNFELCGMYCEHKYSFLSTSISWEDAIRRIRLSKIGKCEGGFDDISGCLVHDNAEHTNQVYRYYEVLAKNFTNAGIPMTVRVTESGEYFSVVNLSGFSI